MIIMNHHHHQHIIIISIIIIIIIIIMIIIIITGAIWSKSAAERRLVDKTGAVERLVLDTGDFLHAFCFKTTGSRKACP